MKQWGMMILLCGFIVFLLFSGVNAVVIVPFCAAIAMLLLKKK